MATCEANGHLWGRDGKCIMCKALKPRECPFCDVRDQHYTARCMPLEPEGWVCGCKACGACGPIDDTEELAIEAWNRRESELKDFA